MTDEPRKTFVEQFARIKEASNTKTDTELGRVLGIKQGGISTAKMRGKVPANWFVKISNAFGVSVTWLIHGIGPMLLDPDAASPDHAAKSNAQVWQNPPVFRETRNVPVIGLATCGITGWYNPGPLAISMSMPVENNAASETFAVVAIGTSMQPEGIRHGYVVFCDPATEIFPNDVIYIERADGTASLKMFLKKHGKSILVQGWLPPNDEGVQKPYTEEIPVAMIKRKACVVLVKRKP